STWLIVLFVPTYSVTETLKEGRFIREVAYLLPWMILTRYTPNQSFNSDQYSVVAFPWSLIQFIPFLYVLRAAWRIYENKLNDRGNVTIVIVSAFIQIIVLYLTYLSQDFSKESGVDYESVKIYFLPQLLLITIYTLILIKIIRNPLSKIT
ncbi:MAG: hypothetical protein ACC656_08715, partial [Candidatus Heimdallarchaeota archaeon]